MPHTVEQKRAIRRARGAPERGSPEHRAKVRAERTQEVVGWWAIHTRLRTLRGPALQYECVDCGRPARNWSLSWRRVDVEQLLYATTGALKGCPYSLDLSHYDPRCVKCAQRYDIGGIGRVGLGPSSRTRCPHGHPYDATNTRLNVRGARECRTCGRERNRAYKARRRERTMT